MKIALAQIAVVRGELEQNLDTLKQCVREAAAAGAETVCFPEMCTTGFDWSVNRRQLQGAASIIQQIQTLACEQAIAICGSFLEKTERGNAANTFYFIEADGSITAKYRKLHLFSLFNEELHVEAGSVVVVAHTSLGHLGCSICYDLRFPELFRACMNQGAEIQMLPAAFPHPRLAHWQTLVRARAVENQCFFVAVNQCGAESHSDDVGDVQYFGHSMVVDPWGEVLVEADESAGLFYAEVNVSVVAETRSRLTALDDRRPEVYT